MCLPVESEEIKNKVIQKAWEDPEFKKELLENPREALKKEFNILIPESVNLNILEDKQDDIYLVLPLNPDEVVGGDEDAPIRSHW